MATREKRLAQFDGNGDPPPSRRILAQGAAGLRRDHIALERGIRQPTTVASTMPPVLSFRQWPSIQRQANGS